MTDEEFQQFGRDKIKADGERLFEALRNAQRQIEAVRYPFGIDDLLLIDGIYQTVPK